MKISNITGLIKRRILVNYRVVPEVIQPLLPLNFRPKLHNGSAIAGICLIRLEQVRPKGVPGFLGMSSENAAHRIAVIWEDEQGREQEGVYITRRDTNSRFNQAVGGRFFSGEHHAANFHVTDDGTSVDFEMKSEDGSVNVQVYGKQSDRLGPASTFENVAAASAFFESGSLGYSATIKRDRLEGLRLVTSGWKVTPLEISHVHSTFFADGEIFPKGSVTFDCALIMRDIEHEWQGESDLLLGKAT